MGELAVAAVLAVIAVLAVRSLWKGRGKDACCGDCSRCRKGRENKT